MVHRIDLDSLTNFIKRESTLRIPKDILRFINEGHEFKSEDWQLIQRQGKNYIDTHQSRLEPEKMYPVLRKKHYSDTYDLVYSPEDGRFICFIIRQEQF